MKLGLGLDVWSSARFDLPLDRVLLAERLGYDSVWTAEIYGADAVTPLAFLAAHTSHLRLGTAVAQVAARPPTTAAMQFGTLEAMAPGRVVCGLGLWFAVAAAAPSAARAARGRERHRRRSRGLSRSKGLC